jgi:hypothetical protein
MIKVTPARISSAPQPAACQPPRVPRRRTELSAAGGGASSRTDGEADVDRSTSWAEEVGRGEDGDSLGTGASACTAPGGLLLGIGSAAVLATAPGLRLMLGPALPLGRALTLAVTLGLAFAL